MFGLIASPYVKTSKISGFRLWEKAETKKRNQLELWSEVGIPQSLAFWFRKIDATRGPDSKA